MSRDTSRHHDFEVEIGTRGTQTPNRTLGNEVVFVDNSIDGYENLIDALPSGMSVVEIDGSLDGLARIAEWARGHRGYDALHVLCHGTKGRLLLGSFVLDTQTAKERQADLASIGRALNTEGSILLYGCEVAAADGGTFVDELARLSGARIAASSTLTGAAALGGDWQLDRRTGAIVVAPLELSSYQGVLLPPSAGPSVSSIVRSAGASATVSASTSTVYFQVTFSEAVTGVDPTDFTLTASGTAAGTIDNLSGSGSVYTVAVNNVSGDGTLRLDLNGSGTGIKNGANEPIASGYFSGASYVFDHTAPLKPFDLVVQSNTDSGQIADQITSFTAPIINGKSEANGTVSLYDSDGTTLLGSTTANSSGRWSITSSTLTSGTHSLTAKQTDAAGNISAASDAFSLTIDTMGPTNMALSTNTVQVAAATNGSTVATLSSTDITTVTYSFAVGNGTIDADNGKFTIAGTSLTAAQNLTTGTYHIYLSATDAADNRSYQVFTVNVANSPSVSSISRAGAASSTVNTSASSVDYTVTFSQSVTGVDTSDFSLTRTGTANGTIANISGNGTTYTITVNGLTGDGTLRLDLKNSGTGIQNGTSEAILSGYSLGQTFTLDHTAPAAPSTPALTTGSDSGVIGDGITKITVPVLRGTAENGSTVKLFDSDGTTLLGTTTATGGTYSITSSTLSEGSHALTVKAVDAAGNVSAASAARTVVVDTTVPVVAFANQNGSVYAAAQTLSGTVTDSNAVGTTVTLKEGALQLGTATVQANGSWSTNVTLAGFGPHTLTASGEDLAGNAGQATLNLTLTDPPDLSEPSTPTKPETKVTIVAVEGTSTTTSQKLMGALPTAVADQLVIIKDGNTVLATVVTDALGKFGLPLTFNGDGPIHTYHLTASVAGTNGGASISQAFDYTIDFTPNQSKFGTLIYDAGGEVGAIHGLYQALLGRTPDSYGLNGFTSALDSGANLVDVANAILNSAERGPTQQDSAAYIQSLYQNVLHRSADATGLQTFTDAIAAGMSRAAVAVQIATSEEAKAIMAPTFAKGVFTVDASEASVARLYHGLLGRAPDAGGLQALSAFVENGGGGAAGEAARLGQAAAAIISSTEYTSGHSGSDMAFVADLYLGALGRSPDAGGQAAYLDQLAHGVSRATVALEITQSPEAQVHLVGQIEHGWHLV